jgi:hypothetical protein
MLKGTLCNYTDFSVCEVHNSDFDITDVYTFVPSNDKLPAAAAVCKKDVSLMMAE